MSAHLSDWHSNNPDLHPLGWVVAFTCVIVVYLAAMAALGTIINAG